LTTCVHLVTGLVETPNDAAPFSGAVVEVMGVGATLPLFRDGQKRFTVVTNEIDGNLVDALTIELTPIERHSLSRFGMHKIGSIVRARIGDTVTARGFPGLDGVVVQECTYEAKVEQIEGVSIKLSEPSAPGASGSAVVNEKGLIGILHGDIGEPSSLRNALVVSLPVVASALFRSGIR
jgi:V8-like Glu-specific endopeptidase